LKRLYENVEEEDDNDSFVDNDEELDDPEVARYLEQIRTKKRGFTNDYDDDIDDMEVNRFDHYEEQEAKSLRLGLREDHEEERKEKQRKKEKETKSKVVITSKKISSSTKK